LPHGTYGREDTATAHLNENPVQQVAAARAALAALALEYESVAFAGAVEEPSLGSAMRAALRKEHRPRQ
jgi:hypothetical protein